MSGSNVRAGMALSAVSAGALGMMLLFAPEEMSGVLSPAGNGGLLTPLLGAALLGFGALNWTARGMTLGGIYGRAVVVGNQTHLAIGAIVLVKHAVSVGNNHVAYWVLTAVYLFGAAFFSYLTFFSSGIREQ